MRAELGVEPVGLVGMHPAEPLLGSGADLVLVVSQHLLPARGAIELAAPQAPILESVSGALDRERVTILALDERLFGAHSLRRSGGLVDRGSDAGVGAR